MKKLIFTFLFACLATQTKADVGLRVLGGYGLGMENFHTDLLTADGPSGLPLVGTPGSGLTGAGEVFYDWGGNLPAAEAQAPATKIKPLRIFPTSKQSAPAPGPGLEFVAGVYDLSLRYGSGNSTFYFNTLPIMAGLNLICPLGQGIKLFTGLAAGYVPGGNASFHSERYAGSSDSPYPFTTSDGSIQYAGGFGMRGNLGAEYQISPHMSVYLGAGLIAATLYPASASYTHATTAVSGAAPASQTITTTFKDNPSGPDQDWSEGLALHFTQVSALAGLVFRY